MQQSADNRPIREGKHIFFIHNRAPTVNQIHIYGTNPGGAESPSPGNLWTDYNA